MLDQIIENIIQKIRKEVVQPGMERIPLAYIFTRNIPASIKHFFDQEVELWIREEAEKFSASERFDYQTPEVQVLIDKIFDVLKQTATFHINQFNRLLERAIKLEANYLIRPHQTLTQFLFKDHTVVSTIEVYDMLKYFDKFQYYKDALTDYFNLKYLRQISQSQFEELIRGIDQQVFAKSPVETVLQTVKTINNFVNEGRPASADTLDLKMLLVILKDRNLDGFAALIERQGEEGGGEISISDLEQILRTGKTLRQLRKARAEEKVTVKEIADIEKEKPKVEVESISVSEEVQIPAEAEPEVEEVEEEEYEEEEEQPAAAAAAPLPGGRGSAAEQLADLVGQKMRGDHLEDITRLISPKQRKKFIKKIFKKKEKHFLEFLSLMNNTPNWKHASNLIDSYFYQQGINPYSKEALEFSDLVYNRYFPKDIAINKGQEFKF